MAPATNLWTIERVHALPDDGKRYEVIEGELFVTPSPTWRHQEAVGELFLRLRTYLNENASGHVVVAPADVDFDRFNLVQPDVFVVPRVGGKKPGDFREAGRLLLAVEVLSPSTQRADREAKRRLFQTRAVEYWIVNVEGRVIERWLPGANQPALITGRLEWKPDPAAHPFVLDVESYFAAVGEG